MCDVIIVSNAHAPFLAGRPVPLHERLSGVRPIRQAVPRRWIVSLLCLLIATTATQGLAQDSPPDATQLVYGPDTVRTAREKLKRLELSQARDLFRVVRTAAQEGRAPASELLFSLRALIEINRRLDEPQRTLDLSLEYMDHLRKIPGAEGKILETVLVSSNVLMGANRHDEALQLLESELKTAELATTDSKLYLSYLIVLARATTRVGDNDTVALERWREAAKLAKQAIDEREDTKKWQGPYSFYVYRLAECFYGFDQHREALVLLINLLRQQTEDGDQPGRRQTMRFIATFYRSLQNHAKSSQNLHEAIGLQKLHFEDDKLILGILYGDMLSTGQEHGVEPSELQDAEKLYHQLVRAARANEDVELLDFCLEQLRGICTHQVRYEEAQQLAEELVKVRERSIGLTHRLTNDARAELGLLYGKTGRVEDAIALLKSVVKYWEDREPQQPLPLADALSDLGALHKEVGQFEQAQPAFERVLELRVQHLPKSHPDLVPSYSNLATVCLARGQFQSAIQRYEKALAICEHHGIKLKKNLSRMKLNLALAYRSLGQLDKAGENVEKAMQLQIEMYGDESFGLVGYYNALAALHRAQGKNMLRKAPSDKERFLAHGHFEKAAKYSEQIIRKCSRHGQTKHPIMSHALHHLADVAMLSGNLTTAEKAWNRALDIQKTHNEQGLISRTLNNLGGAKVAQRDSTAAEAYFRQALEIHDKLNAFPQEHYSVLCNMAVNLYQRGNRPEAGKYLAKAIQEIETPRTASSAAEGERARFQAKFSRAFETLVDWRLQEYVDGGELDEPLVEEAFLAAERGRNRTFLDLLNLAGVDLRDTVEGEEGDRLRQREAELRLKIKAIRTEALEIRSDIQAEGLRKEFARAQEDYAQVWKEIRNASSFYRNVLSEQGRLLGLQEIRQQVLDDDSLILMYFLGSQKSWLMVFGSQPGDSFVFPLVINVQDIDPNEQGFDGGFAAESHGGAERSLGEPQPHVKIRGFVADEPEPEPTVRLGPEGPLTRRATRRLVANYLLGLKAKLTNPDPFRDLQEPDVTFANFILPPDARELIAEFEPKRLIVVPDGALHQLPFEALVFKSGETPTFWLDEMPPMAYAPGCNVLANLLKRQSDGEAKLLTVGNPAYPQWGERKDEQVEQVAQARNAYLDVGGAIPLLPGTGRECAAVAKMFGAAATKYVEQDATEKNLVGAIKGTRFLHVAAHGLVDETHENLFGSLALTPGDDGASENDGFLSFHEILRMPMQGCELAALSACETNVGPERPLEAGSTLAQAFLAAGAKRVMASLWCVSDESTAILMSRVFQRINEAESDGQPVEFAKALQEARKMIKANTQFEAPYYWAPFVLLGPGT